MKYYQLSRDEKKILKNVEAGKYVQVKDFSVVKKDVIAAAKNTLGKTKNINIRLNERILMRLKAKAAERGIPYQTLASSILHQFASN
mgnify:CR=1 FL=1